MDHFNKTRRWSIRKGISEGCTVETRFDKPLFLEMYEKTFHYQNLTPEQSELELLDRLLERLDEQNLLKMFIGSDLDGSAGSVAVFGLSNEKAFYLYGANLREVQSKHVSSVLFWEAFQCLAEFGAKEIDFEGVNSPHRGYFKLSFGGSVSPYYRVFWRSN